MCGWCAPRRMARDHKDYVTAARVAGVGTLRLMFVTVLPNCLAPLIVQAALGFSDAILEAAALGFLGLARSRPRRNGARCWRRPRIHPLQPLDRHASRPRHPDHGARDQSDGRRPARRAGPEAEEELRQMALLEIRNLRSRSRPSGAFRAVDGVDLIVDRARCVGHRRRVRLRQVRGDAGRDGPAAWTATVTADRMRFDGQRPAARSPRASGASIIGKRHRDDLPGADGQPQPVLHRRLPDRRDAEGASRARQARRARARDRAAGAKSASPSRSGGCRPSRTSSPAA